MGKDGDPKSFTGENEVTFQIALEDFTKPGRTSVDVRNGLSSLASLEVLPLSKAQRVMELAASQVVEWVEASDGKSVLGALSTAFSVSIEHIRQSNGAPEVLGKYVGNVGTILTGVLRDVDSYRVVLEGIRDGRFGGPKDVKKGHLKECLRI